MQLHNHPLSPRKRLTFESLSWPGFPANSGKEGRRIVLALDYLPLAGLPFHLPKARHSPAQQAGEELARTGVPSPALPPLWYFCSWRLLVASKKSFVIQPPSTTLFSSLLKSRFLCPPNHTHSHTCTRIHTHTYTWPLVPKASVDRWAQVGRQHLPSWVPLQAVSGPLPCLMAWGMGSGAGKLSPGFHPRGPEHSGPTHSEGSCPRQPSLLRAEPPPKHLSEWLWPKTPNPEDRRISSKTKERKGARVAQWLGSRLWVRS